MTTVSESIEQILRDKLKAEVVEVVDESSRHVGHAGAQSGGGHYQVLIVSALFEGQARIERHQLIYKALAGLMQSQIHALALKTLTPGEWQTKGSSHA